MLCSNVWFLYNIWVDSDFFILSYEILNTQKKNASKIWSVHYSAGRLIRAVI